MSNATFSQHVQEVLAAARSHNISDAGLYAATCRICQQLGTPPMQSLIAPILDAVRAELHFEKLVKHLEMPTDIPTDPAARNQLRVHLWGDNSAAHAWVCHNGNLHACPDGCDIKPDPTRSAFYNSSLEEAS